MKKIMMTLLLCLAAVSFTACSEIVNDGPTGSAVVTESAVSEEEASSTPEESEVSEAESTAESEEPVDEDSVRITVPDYLLSSDEDGELTSEQIAVGFRSSKKNEDGSISYLMKKDNYDAYVDSVKEGAVTMLDHMTDGDYSSIHDVKYNNGLTQVVLYVDQTAYENSSDSYVIKGIGSSLALYHVYNGVDAEELEIVIQVENSETNEVLETVVYPER